ncbi:hypothetical protein H5410_056825 [Solanum commersonii]|uniref:Polyprotein protein n=1 Tax=Solanum commersonii TaxID=4109 RepID=A0A9J5WLA7_SOLCO|nr:hypothetical protein H5410_056825 [Solanum commersonii]
MTQAILRMGHLAHSAEVRATRLERSITLMIEAVILAALAPLQISIDTLTMIVEAYESRQGGTSKIPALKARVAVLRKDVDNLKSTDFTSLLDVADDLDSLDTSETSGYHGDVPRDEAAVDESAAMTDEEQIAIREESIYRDLPDLGETIMQLVIQTSRTETFMAAPSGFGTVVSSKETPWSPVRVVVVLTGHHHARGAGAANLEIVMLIIKLQVKTTEP